jgi:hypothetical protein
MSKQSSWGSPLTKGLVLVIVGLIALFFSGELFMLFFAPAVVYYLWDQQNRLKALEGRLPPPEKAPSEGDHTN